MPTTLRPYPFPALIRRVFRELQGHQSIFDLPCRKFFTSVKGRDLGVSIHGRDVSTPLGPAAGPHSQLAQNIVLSWLAGGRVIELKTVQILDDLVIPRPCIDMQTVGFNVEWSQELRIEQSLQEYIKAAMLIEMLVQSGQLTLPQEGAKTLYDVSLGYDLAGITSPSIQGFLRNMMNATSIMDQLRREIPHEYRHLRDLDFSPQVARSVTLSTFHGCPPAEIEQIIALLLRQPGLDCTIKLNPTLLGKNDVHRLLHDVLGYHDIHVPDHAFDQDPTWNQIVEAVERMGTLADSLGRSLGIKLTNTLVVDNHRDFFPSSQRQMYLSGPPLHVLAMNLVQRFRRQFGDRFPISFSGGIDWANFTDAVALGLRPITVCTDWLKPGGYGRAHRYFDEIDKRMARVNAVSVNDFVLQAYGMAPRALDRLGLADSVRDDCARALARGENLETATPKPIYARWVSEARLLNTHAYLERLANDSRYDRVHNERIPRKVGQQLKLFDCMTCDKCIPVCPNDANFTVPVSQTEIPIVKLLHEGEDWVLRRQGFLHIDEKHQIGCFTDFCNECGNCDVFCPEDGGPYRVKPRFFGSLDAFRQHTDRPGFYLERRAGHDRMFGRFDDGEEYHVEVEGDRIVYAGQGFQISFTLPDIEGTLRGHADGDVDLVYFGIMNALREAVLHPGEVNFINCLQRDPL